MRKGAQASQDEQGGPAGRHEDPDQAGLSEKEEEGEEAEPVLGQWALSSGPVWPAPIQAGHRRLL